MLLGNAGNDAHDCGVGIDAANGGPGIDTASLSCEATTGVP